MHVSMRVDERNSMVLKFIFLSPKVTREKRFRPKKTIFSSSDVEESVSDLEVESGTVRLR